MINLAIDLMGGDLGPAAALEGCAASLSFLGGETVLNLFGNDEAKKLFDAIPTLSNNPNVHFHTCSEVIGYDEPPAIAIRKKKDSSMACAIRSVAVSENDCVVSSGNTGALLAGSTLIIRRTKGVHRPAIATLIPTTEDGHFILIDSGANTDSKPEYLLQFAKMGTEYAKIELNLDKPRVGLLSNGAEEGKGNELTKQTYDLLKGSDLFFVGNCEPSSVFSGRFDVVVADGFDGNILLKSIESTAKSLFTMLKGELMSSFRSKIGALLAKPAFRTIRDKMDPSGVGGAPLLGLNGGVIKAHGNSNAKAFCAAILQAERLTSRGLFYLIGNSIASEDIPSDTD